MERDRPRRPATRTQWSRVLSPRISPHLRHRTAPARSPGRGCPETPRPCFSDDHRQHLCAPGGRRPPASPARQRLPGPRCRGPVMTTPLRVVGPAGDAERTSPLPLQDQLRELVASILVDDCRVFVTADDPVGGGPACAVAGCPRSRKGDATVCAVHHDRWVAAGESPISTIGTIRGHVLGLSRCSWAGFRRRCAGRSPTASSKRDNTPTRRRCGWSRCRAR